MPHADRLLAGGFPLSWPAASHPTACPPTCRRSRLLAVRGFKAGGTSPDTATSWHSPQRGCDRGAVVVLGHAPCQEVPFSRGGTNLTCPFSPSEGRDQCQALGTGCCCCRRAGRQQDRGNAGTCLLEEKPNPPGISFIFTHPLFLLRSLTPGFAVAFSFSVINKQLPWEPCY